MTHAAGIELRVVDNRAFLKGLDELYRAAMKVHESGELLECARAVCNALEIAPANVPIEGYYAENDRLTEYFRRMRALQNVPGTERPRVEVLPAFHRLLAVTSSRLFGIAGGEDLLPTGVDPLTTALASLHIDSWTTDALVAKARDAARAGDDYSLVGLAAFAGDAVSLAALRETAVLYAMAAAGGIAPDAPEIRYEWKVDPELAERAAKFVATFNALFNESLPEPRAAEASRYWIAADIAEIWGRCVRIGYDDRTRPFRQYHWGIHVDSTGGEFVHEFWADEIWTTERFRNLLMESKPLP